MSTAPTPSPLDLWQQYAAKLPDLPDVAYDAQREKFSNEVITPWALKQGFSPSAAHEAFMKSSERAGKSQFPRAELVAKTAVTEALSPLAGLAATFDPGARVDQAKLESWQKAAEQEAVRQGISPTGPELLGKGIGSAPYFVAGGGAGRLLTGGAEIAGNVLGMALGSAAMDAARAQDGQRLVKGIGGAVEGAVTGAAFEVGLGALGLLKSTPAEAVEKTLKGVATPAEQEVAHAATVVDPKLPDKVVQQTAQDAQAAQDIGVPAAPPQVVAKGAPLATFKTRDGKTYQIPADQLAAKVAAGDSLETIAGSATEIQTALKTAEKQASKAGKLKLPVTPRGAGSPARLETPETDTVLVRPEGVAPGTIRPPSTTPSVFKDYSTDYMERYLQERVLDDSVEQSARDAAMTRLTSLNPKEAEKVGSFLRAGGPSTTIDISGIEAAPKVPTVDDEAFLPIYKAISSKGEININSLVSKTGLSYDEADVLIRQGEAAGLLQKSGQIIKSGGAEVIDKYRVVPKKVSEVPDFDKGLPGPAARPEGADKVDALLEKLRARLAEKYPEARADLYPEEKKTIQTLADVSQWLRETGGIDYSELDKPDIRPPRPVTPKDWLDILDPKMIQYRKMVGFKEPTPEEIIAARTERVTHFKQAGYDIPEYELPSASTETPSELEQQLRASLEKLKFPGTKFAAPAEPGLGLPPMNPAVQDINMFRRVGKKNFVDTLTELDPTLSAEEAGRYYDWNVNLRTPTDRAQGIPNPRVISTEVSEEGSLARTTSTGLIEVPPEGVARGTLYHEGLHSNFTLTGLDRFIPELINDETAADLFARGFQPEVRDWYAKNTPQYVPEETFVWLAQAYRSGDRRMLQGFADADTDRETLDAWFAGRARELLGYNSVLPDSLAKRALDRRLNDLINRSGGSLEQMSAQTSALGSEVDFNQGRWEVRDSDSILHRFESREELSDYLHDNHSAPLNTPELVDYSGLPPGLAGPSARPHGPRAPIGTNPPPPELRPGKDIKAGSSVISFFFRPFYAWADSVAEKFHWPELSQRMHALQAGEIEMNNAMRDHQFMLRDTIGQFKDDRQSLLFKIVEAEPADRPALAEKLGVNQDELDALTEFNEKFVTPLESELGASLELFIRKYQGASKLGLDELTSSGLGNRAASSPFKFLEDGWRTGELDPRDQNLTRVAHEYLRLGMRKKYLEQLLIDAANLVNSEEGGSYVAGNLQPLLARHINYLRGVPDYSARIVHEGVGVVTNLINETFEKVNKVLPDSWKLDPLEVDPREALNKWIAYSYAGGLMYRPMVLLRDSLQYFLTTFPILGPKYSMRGLEAYAKSFGRDSDSIWKIPEQYGALIGDRDILNFQTGAETRVNKAVQWWMQKMQYSNNSNRLAAFWGHAERIKDTLDDLGREGIPDREAFAKQAGLNYLTKTQRENYLNELYMLTPERRESFIYRAAKDLVDVSQWNYSRGSTPGAYKYGLGKLFGQYGTWPLNYIEYIRRIAGAGDAGERVATLTRLFAAHTAILKAGELLGIDTGGWVFTQPMAYGGSPVFTAVTSIPQSFDFETQQGADARRKVIRPIFPMSIPGGLAGQTIFKAIRDDDPDVWKIILGFHPMKPAEYGHGIHLVPPETEPR